MCARTMLLTKLERHDLDVRMSKAKPNSVDENAWWSASDNEWILAAKDDADRLHGLVTYWRPDGTLVNHCEYEHGVPHGSYKRYHETGEVSRQGTFVQGQLHGTDIFIRTEGETTESFPAGLSSAVWRAEMDMVNGSMVAGRLYNSYNMQVGEDGEPCPERPQDVPAEAVYSSTSNRWVLGNTNQSHERDGRWTFYTSDGWIQQEVEYADGEEQSKASYPNRYASSAARYLRDENFSECIRAIDAGVSELDNDSEQLHLLALRTRCQDQEGDAEGALATASQALSSFPVQAHWGRFTAHGKRAFTATAELEAYLAVNHLSEERAAQALECIRKAIEHTSKPQARFYAIKADALAMLGRDDEQFASVKAALNIDADAPEVAQFRDDPSFSEWLNSIDPKSMTEEGAWEILGEAGLKLEQYRGVLVDEDEDDEDEEEEETAREAFDPESMDYCLDGAFNLQSLPSCSPELVRFSELCHGLDIHHYRGEHASACESTLTAAVQTIDGNWLSRIQSLFLPASVVNLDNESMVLASWHATAHQTSRTYSIHQDDAEFGQDDESISAMIASKLELDDEDTETTISERTKMQWLAATGALGKQGAFPAPFELLEFEPRTHWIVNLLIGKHPDIVREIFLGEGIKRAATNEDWEREREHLAWPHLQAYWLFHHAVFENHTRLAEVLQHANTQYPAVTELAIFAKQLLAGEPVKEIFWNEDRVGEYRLQSLDERPDLLSAETKAKLRADNNAVFEANEKMTAAFAELANDPENEGLVGFLQTIEGTSGSMDASQNAIAQQFEKPTDFIMAIATGRVTPFEDVFANLAVLPQRVSEVPARKEPLMGLFEAALARSASSPDDHVNTMPGTLYGLGQLTVASASDFDAFLGEVKSKPFYPEKFGRFRRLEVAMLATPYLETSAEAKAFLQGEAARFAEQSQDWKTDTFAYADRILTESGDEGQIRAINERLCETSFSGANWRQSIDLVQRFLETPSPLMKDGLKAAVENGLGRHDDGDRAVVVRAYAACAGADGRDTIIDWLGSIDDVRKDCETAALLAGLIEIDAGTDAIGETKTRAVEALASMGGDSMRVGAAISLLQAVHAHKLPGFAGQAKRFPKLAEEGKYSDDSLKVWIVENLESFA